MKENNLNWVGNRVLDPNVQQTRPSREQSPKVVSPTSPLEQPKAPMNHSPMMQSPMMQSPMMQSPMMQSPNNQKPMEYTPMTQVPMTQQPFDEMPGDQMPFTTQSPAPQRRYSPLATLETPPTLADKNYIPGYLTSLIGRRIRAEFVLGTNMFMDKTGVLREVGVNYFVLEDLITRSFIICDLYSVRFVTTM